MPRYQSVILVIHGNQQQLLMLVSFFFFFKQKEAYKFRSLSNRWRRVVDQDHESDHGAVSNQSVSVRGQPNGYLAVQRT